MGIEVFEAPLPVRQSIRAAMKRMDVGETFIVDAGKKHRRTGLYATARALGVGITTLVRPDGRIQVWCVERPINEPGPIEPISIPVTGIDALRAKISAIENQTDSPPTVSEEKPNEWIDRGERFDEVSGEMLHVEQHYKTGKFRVKE